MRASTAGTGAVILKTGRPGLALSLFFRRASLTPDQLAETIAGTAEEYWRLHGFRTARGDERHDPPPFWNLRHRRAWREGKHEGLRWLLT